MRLQKRIFLLLLFIFFLTPLEYLAAESFVRDLFVGSKGADVRALQEILNDNQQTQLAVSGPGSPGLETDYFGPLTRSAVKQFQELYADEILLPLGLSSGTGFVGKQTRLKINSLAGEAPGVSTEAMSPPSTEPLQSHAGKEDEETDLIRARAEELRNLAFENFDTYERAVRKSLNESHSDSEIEEILDGVREGVGTADYERLLREDARGPRTSDEILEEIRAAGGSPDPNAEEVLRKIFDEPRPLTSILIDLFLPKVHAQLLTPYGSILNIPYPCLCSGTVVWQMALTGYIYGVPFEFLADYVVGTQLYSYYTLPIPQKQVGFLLPPAGLCWEPGTPCVVIPSVGTVSPIVGSSTI